MPSGAKVSVNQGCSAAASDSGCTRRAGHDPCRSQHLNDSAKAATTVIQLLFLSTLLPIPLCISFVLHYCASPLCSTNRKPAAVPRIGLSDAECRKHEAD